MDYLYKLDRSHRFDIYLGHKPLVFGQTVVVKVAVREPCCNHGLVYATNTRRVSIINMTTDTLLQDVLLRGYPTDITLGNVSKDTGYPKVYVANGASGTVSIINGTAKAAKDIPVGISPTRIVYNPTWNMIYVLGYTPHTTAYLSSQLRNGSVSVIDGATDKVATGVIFKVNPANSGNITCNNETYPTNTYIYVDSGTDCKVQNNNGFDFINWVELTNRNASIPLESSSSHPENLIVDRYGIFTANFRQERPLSADQLFTYLTGAISAAVAVNGVILLVPGWRRARTQRTHLRECIKMIDDDAGKSHKDAIEDKIIGYYVDGKLSEDHRQLLNDKISEYYGSVKGSESDA
jgi:YVTN family beta-propeller protein